MTFFCDFWPLMTFIDLETNFLGNLTPRASFWGIICIFSIKFEIWPFLRFLTFYDLQWPRDKFFWKPYVKSFILRYNLTICLQVRNLTFLTFFRYFWPWVTPSDLENSFCEKTRSRASFWRIIWPTNPTIRDFWNLTPLNLKLPDI